MFQHAYRVCKSSSKYQQQDGSYVNLIEFYIIYEIKLSLKQFDYLIHIFIYCSELVSRVEYQPRFQGPTQDSIMKITVVQCPSRFDLYSLNPSGSEDEKGIKKAAENCMWDFKIIYIYVVKLYSTCNSIIATLKGELNPKIKFVLFERTLKITE